MFKTERLLIRVAAVLGAIGIVMVALLYVSINVLKATEEMQEAIESSGQQISDYYFTPTYFILTILSILIVVALFIIANKLNLENYKIMGAILIILCIPSYWLLWFVPIILIFIAGIMILFKGRKYKNYPEIVE